jgi:soluble lytic murein transglycosylase-like protein
VPFFRRPWRGLRFSLSIATLITLSVTNPLGVAAAAELGVDTMATSSAEVKAPSLALVHKILKEAALRHHVDPNLVLALSYWESGWDQSRVSATGAVGLMQVEPPTADAAGPALLGRPVNLDDPFDNADVGTAVLREDLDTFHDPALALAAYYEGPTALRVNGISPDAQQYAQGILALASRIAAGS